MILVVMAAVQSLHTESNEFSLPNGLYAISKLAAGNAVNRAKLSELGACAGI